MVNSLKLLLLNTFLFISGIHAKDGLLRGQNHQARRRLEGEVNSPAFIAVIDTTSDLIELCYSMETLVRAKGHPDAPIFIFHGFSLPQEEIETLAACSSRAVTFVEVSTFYNSFPGIEPVEGIDYTHQQTQRFLITELWELPHLESHDMIFRFSDSTCLSFENDDIPGFPSDNLPLGFNGTAPIVYQSQAIPHTYGFYMKGPKYVRRLYDRTVEYMTENELEAKNVEMWANIVEAHETYHTLPLFRNDGLEIIRKSFFVRDEVKAYHHMLTDEFADEFYYFKWNVNVVRYMTVAIFGEFHEILNAHVPGIMEKDFLNKKSYVGVCRMNPDEEESAE